MMSEAALHKRCIDPSSNIFWNPRMTLATTLRFLAVALLVSAQCFATGWPRQERQTYLHFGWNGFSADTYQAGTTSVAVDQLSENSFALYGEYGYSQDMTGMVRLPGYRILSLRTESSAPAVNVEAPGDVELGLRYALWNPGNSVLNISVMASFPLGETSDRMGLWTGDNEYNQVFGLEFGHRFESFPAFISVFSGFNNRNNGYSDELRFGAEVGVADLGPVSISMLLHAVEPLNNGKADYTGGNYGFATNRQRYMQYGPEITMQIVEGFGINVAALAVSGAENVPSAMMFRSGLYFTLDRSRHAKLPADEYNSVVQ